MVKWRRSLQRRGLRLIGAEPLLGERATKRGLENGLRLRGDLRVLHVACHGEFDRAERLRSRIRLAPPPDGEPAYGDPDLSAREVLDLEVEADPVALSACASGVSGGRARDELIGLTRSFLYAGAPSMILGLWYVADGSTRLLMESFYRALLSADGDGAVGSGRTSKAEALQCAQRTVTRTAGYDHPYFWFARAINSRASHGGYQSHLRANMAEEDGPPADRMRREVSFEDLPEDGREAVLRVYWELWNL